jgi:hypothetical protein
MLIVHKPQMKYLIQNPTHFLKGPNQNTQTRKPHQTHRQDHKRTNVKISKFLVKKLNDYVNLKHQYNVKDTIFLVSDLTTLKIDEKHRMITFDIKDLHFTIPIKETLRITETLLAKHNMLHTPCFPKYLI